MADNAPPSQNVDEGGEIVLNRFYDFLAKFTSSAEGTTDGTDGVQLYRDYLAQIAAMVENEKNTVYVDVQHVFAVSERALLCPSDYRRYLICLLTRLRDVHLGLPPETQPCTSSTGEAVRLAPPPPRLGSFV